MKKGTTKKSKILYKIYTKSGREYILTADDFFEKNEALKEHLSVVMDRLMDALYGKCNNESLIIGKYQFHPKEIEAFWADF